MQNTIPRVETNRPLWYQRLRATLATTPGWAVFIFGLAVLVRVAYALVAGRLDPALVSNPLLGDAGSYTLVARTLLAGGGYATGVGNPTAFWPPLYPTFLAAIYWLFGYHLTIARVIQGIIAAGLPPLFFLAAHEVKQTRAGRWASLGAVFYPYLLYFGAWLIAESIFFAFNGLFLWWGLKLQKRPTYRGAALMGLLLGLMTLAKPTVLMQLPFLALWFLLCVKVPWRRWFGLGLVLVVVMGLVLLPWTARNYALYGKIIIGSTNGGYTFYGANNPNAFGGHYENFPPRMPELNEADEQAKYYEMGLSWISQNPGHFSWLVIQKFNRLLSPLSIASTPEDYKVPLEPLVRGLYLLFLLSALHGLILSLACWRDFFLFYVLILGVITSTFLFYGDVRYTLPAVPALLLFSVMSLQNLNQRITLRLPKHKKEPGVRN